MTPTTVGPRNTASHPRTDGSALTSVARWVLAHRRLVIVVWVLALFAGGFGASHVSKRLSLDFSLPGQPGHETAKKIERPSATAATARRR